MNVDESSDDARLRTGDLDRVVRTEHEEGDCSGVELGLEFLVDRKNLVRDDLIKLCVVLNTTEIAVVLDRYERVVLKSRQGKISTCSAHCLCIERDVVALEQLFANIEKRTFTRPRGTVKDQE